MSASAAEPTGRPCEAAPERVGGVVHDADAARQGERAQRVVVAGVAGVVDAQHHLRARRDRPLHEPRVQAQRVGLDVHEHRPRAHVLDDVDARGERVGRGDDLVAGSTPSASSARWSAPVALFTGDRVARTGEFGDALRQLERAGPGRDPAGRERLHHQLALARPDVRDRDRQELGAHGGRALGGERGRGRGGRRGQADRSRFQSSGSASRSATGEPPDRRSEMNPTRRKLTRDSLGLALTQYMVRAVSMARSFVAAKMLDPGAFGAWNALQLMMDYGSLAPLGTAAGAGPAGSGPDRGGRRRAHPEAQAGGAVQRPLAHDAVRGAGAGVGPRWAATACAPTGT
jgi:hypothetical protein